MADPSGMHQAKGRELEYSVAPPRLRAYRFVLATLGDTMAFLQAGYSSNKGHAATAQHIGQHTSSGMTPFGLASVSRA